MFLRKKKNQKHPQKLLFLTIKKLDVRRNKKILGYHFFVQNFHFSGWFWFFWRRHNLVTRTVSQIWWFFSTSNDTNNHFFFSKSWNFQFFLVCEYFLKVPNHSSSIIFQFEKGHKFGDFFLKWNVTVQNWLVKIWFIGRVQKNYHQKTNINH